MIKLLQHHLNFSLFQNATYTRVSRNELHLEKKLLAVDGDGYSIFTGEPVKGLKANSANLDQTPHNVASNQGLHCLLTGSFTWCDNKSYSKRIKEICKIPLCL